MYNYEDDNVPLFNDIKNILHLPENMDLQEFNNKITQELYNLSGDELRQLYINILVPQDRDELLKLYYDEIVDIEQEELYQFNEFTTEQLYNYYIENYVPIDKVSLIAELKDRTNVVDYPYEAIDLYEQLFIN